MKSFFLLEGRSFLFVSMSSFGEKELKIKQNYYVIYYFLNFLENYVELLERGSIMKI